MNLTDHPEDLRNLISLITKKVLGQTTPEDDAALDAWLREDPRNETLLRELLDKQALGRAFRRRDAVDISRPLSDMEARIRRLRPIPVYRRTWFRTGVAALVTGLVCGLALWFRPGPESPLVAGLTETPTDSLTWTPGTTPGELFWTPYTATGRCDYWNSSDPPNERSGGWIWNNSSSGTVERGEWRYLHTIRSGSAILGECGYSGTMEDSGKRINTTINAFRSSGDGSRLGVPGGDIYAPAWAHAMSSNWLFVDGHTANRRYSGAPLFTSEWILK